MNSRVAVQKPHKDIRQAQRRSQRRFVARVGFQSDQIRYISPSNLRQPVYSQNLLFEPPTKHIHQPKELRHSFNQEDSKPASLKFGTSSTQVFSQHVYVSLDYIPDRSRMLWSRWVLAVICLAQLISAFAVVGCHAVDFSEDTKLEVGVSLGMLVFGNIIVTGIMTLILFYRRWRKEETRTRSKAVEANHEAWICSRTAFSLIGMAPIVRYVELLVVYNRLNRLEERCTKEPISPSKEATFQYRGSASIDDLPFEVPNAEKSTEAVEKLNRLRCLFVQLDFDACIVALANATLGAGLFSISQGVLYMRRLLLDRTMPNSTSGAILASFIISFLWLTSAASQFQPDAHYLSPLDLVRIPVHSHRHVVSAGGRVLLFFARGFHISIRLITFTLFASLFDWLLGVVVIAHGILYVLALLIYRGSQGAEPIVLKANLSTDTSLNQRLKSKGVLRHLGTDLLYTYVSIFDFFNGSAGKTRLRMMLYYFFFYLENAVMIGAWYAAYPFTAAWYHLPVLLVVVTVQWIGAIFLQIYLFYFSFSPRGTSLCGLCCPDELRGPADILYSPRSFNNSPVQTAHHLPPPPIDNHSFIIQPTSLYSQRSFDRHSLKTGRVCTPRTDSLTVVTVELPKKPRSRYLYVKNASEEEPAEDWNESQSVDFTVPDRSSNV